MDDTYVFKDLDLAITYEVIPDEAQRRSGIHSGAFPKEVPEWVPGLPSVARDDSCLLRKTTMMTTEQRP
jgi:hypothetical protein